MLARYQKARQQQLEQGQEGFTLIELLIVIVVLGILAAVTVFGLSNITAQSAQSACNADAKTVQLAVEAYHTNTGTWPPTMTALTVADSSGNRYLRTAPLSTHYAVTIKSPATGEVDVAAILPAVVAATNYDVTNNCTVVG
jgi:prepilin-type N-terminal cleavage/methylation domain-containing protein